jgi:hypothetical protein
MLQKASQFDAIFETTYTTKNEHDMYFQEFLQVRFTEISTKRISEKQIRFNESICQMGIASVV